MNAHGTRHVVALDERRFITLSAEAHLIYEARLRGDDVRAITAALSRYCGRPYTAAEVERGLAVIASNVERAAAQTRGNVRLLRLELLPAAWVNAIAGRLTWMFAPALGWCITAVTLAAVVASFARNVPHDFSTRTWIVAYALFFFTIIAHEFGHATACRSAGEPAGPIGFTAFFMLPALYTDVSRAWLLGRGRRLAVDIGGVYFQLPFVAAFAVGTVVTHSAALFLADVLVLGGIALNLNPVLRFDGYWLLADALDLPNLAHEPLRMVRALARREPLLPGRARWQTLTVACYGVLNAAAWSYAAALSAAVLMHRPADVLAGLRLASTHFTSDVALHLAVTLASIFLVAYGLFTLARSALVAGRQFLTGAKSA
jgi:hypothetical protein